MIQQGFCIYTEQAIIYLKSVVILLKNEEWIPNITVLKTYNSRKKDYTYILTTRIHAKDKCLTLVLTVKLQLKEWYRVLDIQARCGY